MTYIIAEIGFNHEGILEDAVEMIELAAEAGADAVKFQTFKAGDIALPTSPHYSAIKQGEVGMDMMRALKKVCDEQGVDFLSTPFSHSAVDQLEELGVVAYKVASMDCSNAMILEYIASKGKPVYLSTGMSTLEEIRQALAMLREHGAAEVIPLHCISKYPADVDDLQLGLIPSLSNELGCAVGYSDHYPGNLACLAAVMQGAAVIETHFTNDTNRPGGDHSHSCDQQSLAELVTFARNYERMIGGSLADLATRSDRDLTSVFRRGAYAAADLPAGNTLKAGDVVFCRPEAEFGPSDVSAIMGKTLTRPVKANAPITVGDLAK